MIFSPELAEKVLSGEKTVTRRPAKHDWQRDVSPHVPLPCRYKVGKDYAVQPGRGKKAIGRILILHTTLEVVSHVAHDTREPRLEGFPDSPSFIAYWRKLYNSFDPNQLVWRIQFQLLRDRTARGQRGGSGNG